MFQEKTLGRWFKLYHTMLTWNLDATAVISKLMHLIIHQKREREREQPCRQQPITIANKDNYPGRDTSSRRNGLFITSQWKKSHWLRNGEKVLFFLWLNDSFRYCYFHDLFGWADPNNYTSKYSNNNITLLPTNDFLTAAVKAVVCSLSDIIPVYWTLPFGLYMASTVNLPP